MTGKRTVLSALILIPLGLFMAGCELTPEERYELDKLFETIDNDPSALEDRCRRDRAICNEAANKRIPACARVLERCE